MAGVLRGKALTREHVPQMPAAAGAGDFGAQAIGIGCAPDRAGEAFVEAGPAATGIELAGGMIQGRAALPAGIHPLAGVVQQRTGKGRLRALVQNDTSFFVCEGGGVWHGGSRSGLRRMGLGVDGAGQQGEGRTGGKGICTRHVSTGAGRAGPLAVGERQTPPVWRREPNAGTGR